MKNAIRPLVVVMLALSLLFLLRAGLITIRGIALGFGIIGIAVTVGLAARIALFAKNGQYHQAANKFLVHLAGLNLLSVLTASVFWLGLWAETLRSCALNSRIWRKPLFLSMS